MQTRLDLPGIKVEGMLAEGGVGRIYGGVHKSTGQRVAIKVLRPERINDPEFIARALQEGRICWSMNHPNVVRVLDYGIMADGRTYLVMERLSGETVWERVDQLGRVESPLALHIARQTAKGLAAVHERGAVHRDIKPENLFICDDGPIPDQVKLLDLGIASLSAQDPRRALWTRQGAIFGSPGYMSPEQCRGETVDARTDVYGLGAVLYFCLFGAIPHGGGRPLEIVSRTARATSVPELPDEVPEALAEVVNRCLQPKAEDRFQSAAEFLDVVEGFSSDPHTSFGSTTIVMRGRKLQARDLHLPTLGDSADHRRFREHVMLAIASMFPPGQLPDALRGRLDAIEKLNAHREKAGEVRDLARSRANQLAREQAHRVAQLEHALSQLESARDEARDAVVRGTARLMGIADRIGDVDRRYTSGYQQIEEVQQAEAARARERNESVQLEGLYDERVHRSLDELERCHAARGELLRELARARQELRLQHRRVSDLSHQILEIKRSLLSVDVTRETTLAEVEDAARTAEDELLQLDRDLEHAFLSLGVAVQVESIAK